MRSGISGETISGEHSRKGISGNNPAGANAKWHFRRNNHW